MTQQEGETTITPSKMKAVTISKYGRTEVLEQSILPVPVPADDQVLVKVSAAALNPRDWIFMRGFYQFKKIVEPFPITLGSDVSGTIVGMGAKVTGFKIGDDVFGMQPLRGKFGGLAEYIKIKATAVAKKPTEVSHQHAAAMPCAGMTSYQSIHDLAKLKPGQTILINGASGGVGSFAVQIAKAAGAKVIAVCGPTNQELCLSLGADEVIDYKSENFESRKSQFDVIFDVIGRSSLSKCKGALKKGGCYITTIPSLNSALAALTTRFSSLNPFGKKLRAHLILVKPRGSDLAKMAQLICEGKMRSLIDTEYTQDQIAEAFEKSQSWRTKGKLIINF